MRPAKKNAAGGCANPLRRGWENRYGTLDRRGQECSPPQGGRLEVQLQPHLHDAWVEG